MQIWLLHGNLKLNHFIKSIVIQLEINLLNNYKLSLSIVNSVLNLINLFSGAMAIMGWTGGTLLHRWTIMGWTGGTLLHLLCTLGWTHTHCLLLTLSLFLWAHSKFPYVFTAKICYLFLLPIRTLLV